MARHISTDSLKILALVSKNYYKSILEETVTNQLFNDEICLKMSCDYVY